MSDSCFIPTKRSVGEDNVLAMLKGGGAQKVMR